MNQQVSRSEAHQRAWLVTLLGLGVALCLSESRSDGGPVKKPLPAKQTVAKKPMAPPAPRSALLTVADWQKVALEPIRAGEIDELVAKEIAIAKVEPAPLTTDEQFIRRITLDLTGELPLPADVSEFVTASDSQKRAKLIDKLLNNDEYAQHWTHYWREVISARLTDRRNVPLARAFEGWLFEELKKNAGWDKIAKAMITAEGEARFDDEGKNGAAFFLGAHRGADAANERAAETSRVFLGIQIQCAQCHDHPSDQWKRVQFHELAAYYARMSERPIREDGRLVGLRFVSMAKGEHEMPSKEDPKKGFQTNPRFLDGKTPGASLGDLERRRSLASAVVQKSNYWFAAAYVNRIWGELMGQSFYQPVDDMGPKKEVVFAEVLTRLTGSFRASNYDVKQLFRDILNSQTYQRQIRLSGASEQHQHFAAAYPTRLPADSLWQSLVSVLGSLGAGGPVQRVTAKKPQHQGFEFLFKEEFGFDPSLKADEVEGSVTQALLMMNNSVLNQRIKANGTNLLARILKSYPQDDEALRMLYLRTLARTPTDREMQKCRSYIAEAGASRADVYEDILWTLLNSTEFQTKR